MTTLTQMDRTATGWRCPRCGSTQEDTVLPIRIVECNCAGLDPFRYGPIVTLAAEQLKERYPLKPRKGWVSEETAKTSEREHIKTIAAMDPETLASEAGVPRVAAIETTAASNHIPPEDERARAPTLEGELRQRQGPTQVAEAQPTEYAEGHAHHMRQRTHDVARMEAGRQMSGVRAVARGTLSTGGNT